MQKTKDQLMEQHLEEILRKVVHLQSAAAKLARLVTSQQEAIQQSEWDTLEAILRQKQGFVDQLASFRNLKPSYLQAIPGTENETSAQLEISIAQLEDSIARISREEQASINAMQNRHVEMGRQLRGLTQNRQAANCYAQSSPNPMNRRIDISS